MILIFLIFMLFFGLEFKEIILKIRLEDFLYFLKHKENFVMNFIYLVLGVFLSFRFQLKTSYLLMFLLLTLLALLISSFYYIVFHRGYQKQTDLAQFFLSFSAYFRQVENIDRSLKHAKNGASPDIQKNISACLGEGKASYEVISKHYIFISMLKMMRQHQDYGNRYIESGLISLEYDSQAWFLSLENYYENVLSFIKNVTLILILTLVVAMFSHNMLEKTAILDKNNFYQQAYLSFLAANHFVYIMIHRLLKEELVLKQEVL